MRIEKVVINASPFILLCKSDLAELLPQLFTEKLYDYEESWIIRVLPTVAEEVLVWNLGEGETDVLSFAYGNENITALVDDRAARKCAETLNIKILGTGGILILAKKRGLISNVSAALKQLQNSGLRISEEVVSLILKQANER